MGKPLRPLNKEQHAQAAALGKQVREALSALAAIAGGAKGAAYVDQALRVMDTVQRGLIDPLRNDWYRDCEGLDDPYQDLPAWWPSAPDGRPSRDR